MPGMHWVLLPQIQEHLGKQTGVQVRVELKLHFNKEHWPIGLIIWRMQNAIEPKGSLFEFN